MMSTCVRAGTTYHRHRLNEGGVCVLCGHQTRSLRVLNREYQNAGAIEQTREDERGACEVERFENEGGGPISCG